MSVPLSVNGETYNYPETGDTDWGSDATDWAEAVTVGTLQKAGGLFQLLDEVDFGTAFGVKSLYYKTRSSNIATIGQFRLANDDLICWRNNANDGDLSLTVDASDALNFNGTSITVGGDPVQVAITPVDTATIDLTLDGSNNLSADINLDSIDNSMIASAAAIIYSKLDLADGIVNADINTSAAIAYSKLSLTSSIVNADISASAAIAYSKLNLTGGIVNADVNTSAAIAYSKLSLSNSIVNADISSSAAIAYSKLNLASSIVDADLSASAAISFSKLAALSSGNILIGSATNVATSVAMSGDIIINDAGVTSYNNNVPLNRGGTNAILTANTGGVVYSGASAMGISSPGTTGQVLISTGAGAPVWGTDVLGVSTNSNASSGYKGQYVESVVGPVAFGTSGQYKDLTSISLSAGDWELTGMVYAGANGASVSNMACGISPNSGNTSSGLAAGSNLSSTQPGPSAAGDKSIPPIAGYRVSLSGTTTYYLKINAAYSVATPNAYGRLSARRVR